MTRVTLIYNPFAGRRRGKIVAAALREALERRGFKTQAYPTSGPNDAATLAKNLAPLADIVVAVGGDGTVNEVINGLAGSRTILGIAPAGTVNVLALELGLLHAQADRPERLADIITRGKILCLDLGRANERRFALMMGAGIDALTVRNLDLQAKRRFRELAFVATGLVKGFSAPPPVFLVRTSGREYCATFFVAGNCRLYANRLSLTRQADPTDGLLDLLIFTGTTRASLAAFWLGTPSGLHLRHPRVVYLRSRHAEILPLEQVPSKDPGAAQLGPSTHPSSAKPSLAFSPVVWFQTDGELAGTLPASVTIEPRALKVLVP